MKDKLESRKEEIKNNIELNYLDWMKLKVLDIEPINKNYRIHLIDSDNYKYCLTYDVIRTAYGRKSLLHKFFRNNIYTIDNIKNYLRVNNRNFILQSDEIINATNKLIWNCPIHGEFSMSWNCVKNGQGCSVCGKLQSSISRKNDFEYVKSMFKKYDMTLISTEYINNEENLLFVCNKHKDKGIQQMSFGQLITTKRCSECGKESQILKQTKSHEEFIREVKLIHGDKYIVQDFYINCKKHIAVYCTNCDDKFLITPNHLLEGHGCPNCNISRGEEKIKLILQDNNRCFIQQYTFENCRNKRKLPFDFAIFKNNELFCLIEYQGIQHYKPVEKFGGKQQFGIQLFVDNIKRNYCLNNNIILIEIPYSKYKDIERILINNNII